MKKLVLCTSLIALAPFSQADTTLGIYAGAGVWQADFDGRIGRDTVGLDQLGFSDENTNFYYFALEHPVPFIPNIKLQYTDLSTNTSSLVNEGFTIDQVTFAAGQNISTAFDLTHTDATLYYEILDNFVSLDLGLTARSFDGELSVVSTLVSERINLDGIIPMGYAKAQIDLPLTGWAVGGDMNWISYSDTSMTDISARVSYFSDLTPLFEVGLEAGYRYLQIDSDDLEDLNTDIEVAGPYVAVIAHF